MPHAQVHLNPATELSDLPLKAFYRYALPGFAGAPGDAGAAPRACGPCSVLRPPRRTPPCSAMAPAVGIPAATTRLQHWAVATGCLHLGRMHARPHALHCGFPGLHAARQGGNMAASAAWIGGAAAALLQRPD